MGGTLTSIGASLLLKKQYEWDFAVDDKDNFTEGGLDIVQFLGFGAGGTKSSRLSCDISGLGFLLLIPIVSSSTFITEDIPRIWSYL